MLDGLRHTGWVLDRFVAAWQTGEAAPRVDLGADERGAGEGDLIWMGAGGSGPGD